MRWYEEFPQPNVASPALSKRVPQLSMFDLGGGTPSESEQERSKVLEISREKMKAERFCCKKSCGDDAYYKSSSSSSRGKARRYVKSLRKICYFAFAIRCMALKRSAVVDAIMPSNAAPPTPFGSWWA